MSVVNSETLAFLLGLRMHELVDALNSLGKVSADTAHCLEELVLVETRRDPEGYVFIASREFRVRFELCDLTLFELPDKAGVFAPKESNVLNIKEAHCPALEPKTEGPANLSI